MAIYSFDDKRPQIGKGSYIHPTADVIGDVRLGENTFVGAGAVVRGDYGTIIVGDNCSIEENCTIHARPGEVCTLGDWVTVGHAAVIHNAKKIGDYVVLGMGSITSDYSEIGEWAVVAEGAVVRNSQKIPPETIVVGIPAREVGKIDEAFKKQWTIFKRNYVDLANTYPQRMKRID